MTVHRVALVLSFSLFACADGSADSATVPAAAHDGDVAHVVVDPAVATWPSGEGWRLEEDLRIGSVGGGPVPEQFGRVGSLASDSHGTIFVLDYVNDEIRAFRPDGTYSHAVGRPGQGPGEFSGARAVTVMAGDTLLVVDDGAMRYSTFAPNGTFLASHRRSIVGYGSTVRGASLADGRYVDWAPAFPDGRMGSRLEYHPVVFDRSLERADTFPPLEYHLTMALNGRMPQLYHGGTVVAAVDRDGSIWFADSRTYRLFKRNLEGDTLMVVDVLAEPVPVTDADREAIRESATLRPVLLQAQLESLPRSKPIIHAIVPDGEGNVLVIANVAGEPAGSVVDVFANEGAYRGRLRLPTPIPLEARMVSPVVHATREYLLVVVEDELDVPNVLRFRIHRNDQRPPAGVGRDVDEAGNPIE